ncbi:MAG: glycoside hydrolase N-terminal domain-containing protein, partial [Firmicutes bacterium]|nr:glycoside hydrolase N-terminal domain-containing protein [Bacillota bacterium]
MVNRLIMKYPTSWHGEMWREGAPCGNGKVGALVYGAVKMEKIMLSHAYLWRGGIRQEMPDISDSLKDVRKYLDENRPDLADGILSNAFAAKGYNPHCVDPTPVGDIVIDSNSNAPFFGYRRVIDMEKAEVSVTWREG